jgi:DNA-binding response OmpR family regulator
MKGSLMGRSILVVEDEPLIAMAISQALEESGAEVTTTNALRHALLLVEHDRLSAAILDHSLGDRNSSLLYARLKERGIPFLIYSGWAKVEGACPGVPHIIKPATHLVLLAAVEDLIRGPQVSN